MTDDSNSSRRSFLKAGALLATPLVAAAPAPALAGKSAVGNARLEDEAAIRALHQAWLRSINLGNWADAARMTAGPRRVALEAGVRSIASDPIGEPDAIALEADGRRASGRFACTVEVVTELAQDSTFAQMAHAQGGGIARATERRTLAVGYVKSADGWKVEKFLLV